MTQIALHKALRRYYPFVIEIHEEPERLLDGSNGRFGSGLHPTLIEWMTEHVHGEWVWGCSFANYRDRHKRRSQRGAEGDGFAPDHDPRVYLLFFFKRAADAAYFRLAHSA